mmetsp:Transcript_28453/g.28779  ORF Transcript_28453/g.28779 Transcript_28453/m.28779 type:complete len:157 (+) Transcript_28453:239-709(+)
MRHTYHKKVSRPPKILNGHRTYTSGEANAYYESLLKERSLADRFEKEKYNLRKDRNPILGGVTPRGEQLWPNPLILPPIDGTEAVRPIKAPKEITAKIGGTTADCPLRRGETVDEFLCAIRRRKNQVDSALLKAENDIKYACTEISRNHNRLIEET